ncbi:MAG: cytochrome c [Gammaproteobacteria bacterium]|nr:cytochrome c [Gammaproteobacteria bacterium]MCW8972119.1 cytochrome c [Gammaproteobacteria bacterium]MCW8993632.1 cytochrome c [Gammaproteobacteria bacterium]
MRQQIVQLTALLSILAIGGTAGATPSAERQAQLLHLLKQDCGSCHGMTLKGGLGPALLPQNLTGKPDAMLIQTVLDGRPGTAMPPWRTMLSHDEVRWLVDNLRKGVDDAP